MTADPEPVLVPARRVEHPVAVTGAKLAGVGFEEFLKWKEIVEAARQLGLGRVPCVRIEHLSETEQRVLRLAVTRPSTPRRSSLDSIPST